MEPKEFWPLDKLKLWKDNPRIVSKENFERLKRQIQELGEYKPLIITPDGTVLGGNMRLRAYRELGYKEAWVSVVEAKTEKEKLKYALSDNDQVGEYQRDDLANLIGNLPDISLGDYSVNLGKSTPISDLLPQEIEEDEAPEVAEGEPVSRLGEVYQLGRHRLMCGDATKIEDVEKLMDGKKADMVFTDPPYGVSYADKNEFLNLIDKGNSLQEEISGDHLDIDDIGELVYQAFSRISEVLADYSSYYITAPQGGDLLLMMMMMMTKAGLPLRHMLIWNKNNHVLGRTDYNYKHEPILYGWKNRHKFYGNGEYTKSVWDIDKPLSSKLHPTMKPVELVSNAIKNSSKKDDIVLDLFGGSGSTLIACEQTNRICYCMELEPHYCDVIRKRYAKFVGKEVEWQEATPRV